MLKIIFLIVIVIGFIAYTGINATSEYETIPKMKKGVRKIDKSNQVG